MDYNNIFINYSKAKKLLSKLFESNDMEYTKKELDKIEDENLRTVLKTQYLYLFQKKMNLLKDNKSGNIIILEDLLNKIKMKKVNEIMEILNKLGYNMILLILLNISKEKILEIKENVKVNIIKYEEIDLEKMNIFNIEEIIQKTVKNVVNKSPNINIEFNNAEKNEYIKMKKELEDKDLEEDTEDLEEDNLGEDLEEDNLGEDTEEEDIEEEGIEEEDIEEGIEEEDTEEEGIEEYLDTSIDIEKELKNMSQKIPQKLKKHIHKKKNKEGEEGKKVEGKEDEEEVKDIMLSIEDRKWINQLG